MLKLMGVEPINETLKLSAIMGTAIHDTIEKALKATGHDTVELTVPGIDGMLGPGHIDFYQPAVYRVTDWKTTTKRNLRYFPKQSQRWQVMVYGYLMRKAGYRVDEVELVAIPRDGHEEDIVSHVEPYDEKVALQALEWLEARVWERDMGVLPEPEKQHTFCARFCPFYGPELCLGL